MKKYFFPAIFAEDSNGISISFPDLKGCNTEAETMEQAYQMAFESAGLYIDDMICDKETIPTAKKYDGVLEKGEFLAMVCVDMEEYYKMQNNKAVKKTLTIPSWLNDIAEKNGINFSNTLQKAIKQELNL